MQLILGVTNLLEIQTLGQETLSMPQCPQARNMSMYASILFILTFLSNEAFQFSCVTVDESNYLEEEMPSHFKNEAWYNDAMKAKSPRSLYLLINIANLFLSPFIYLLLSTFILTILVYQKIWLSITSGALAMKCSSEWVFPLLHAPSTLVSGNNNMLVNKLANEKISDAEMFHVEVNGVISLGGAWCFTRFKKVCREGVILGNYESHYIRMQIYFKKLIM